VTNGSNGAGVSVEVPVDFRMRDTAGESVRTRAKAGRAVSRATRGRVLWVRHDSDDHRGDAPGKRVPGGQLPDTLRHRGEGRGTQYGSISSPEKAGDARRSKAGAGEAVGRRDTCLNHGAGSSGHVAQGWVQAAWAHRRSAVASAGHGRSFRGGIVKKDTADLPLGPMTRRPNRERARTSGRTGGAPTPVHIPRHRGVFGHGLLRRALGPRGGVPRAQMCPRALLLGDYLNRGGLRRTTQRGRDGASTTTPGPKRARRGRGSGAAWNQEDALPRRRPSPVTGGTSWMTGHRGTAAVLEAYFAARRAETKARVEIANAPHAHAGPSVASRSPGDGPPDRGRVTAWRGGPPGLAAQVARALSNMERNSARAAVGPRTGTVECPLAAAVAGGRRQSGTGRKQRRRAARGSLSRVRGAPLRVSLPTPQAPGATRQQHRAGSLPAHEGADQIPPGARRSVCPAPSCGGRRPDPHRGGAIRGE
jgi:hypothetical protein